MQKDMHYYGTYAMARAAGIKKKACEVIARSAEFVDDNAKADSIQFADGARLDALPTAHHTLDIANIDEKDQRQIWVPFHFIPGNEDPNGPYTQRLVCTKDSPIAREMVQNHLNQSKVNYALELMGITAHVYADTFSHYGFSGVSSKRNRIINDSIKLYDVDSEIESYMRGKEAGFFAKYGVERFLDNIKSSVAEVASGALGHGSVLTYPDRPFVKWSFKYEWPARESGIRDNPKTFLEGCEALHGMFLEFGKRQPKYAGDPASKFADIKDEVAGVLATQADQEGRIAAWQKAASQGNIFAAGKETIKEYNAEKLHKERLSLLKFTDSSVVPNKSIFRFYQAASYHRNYILRDLLPAHELLIA